MNIFYIHPEPKICAEMHNDKHCIKMILEYCQLLSTAHRILDGKETVKERYVEGSSPPKYRKVKQWVLADWREASLYSATHINHPSAIWCRENKENYTWLHSLLVELCKEYTYRYGKTHKCELIGLVNELKRCPDNIPLGTFTEPTPAMPDECRIAGDSLASYRNYYNLNKVHLATWQGKVNARPVPTWFTPNQSYK